MGTKFRGIIVPSPDPGIRTTFESITPNAPMALVEVSRHILGVGFLYMTPVQQEYDRIATILSCVAGQAAFYWCHSANGDGYTLYEQGKAVSRHYDECAPLGTLPFQGATYAELERAFYHHSAVLARNCPSLTSVVKQLDAGDFKPSLRGRKNSLLTRAMVFDRLIESGDDVAALRALGDDLIVSAHEWLCTPSALLEATVHSLLDGHQSGKEAS